MWNKVPKREYIRGNGYAPKKNPDKIINDGIIYDPMGQWKYPGEVTKIPGNTMATHGYGNIPLWVVPDNDPARLVQPNSGQQVFPNSTNFTEYPQLPIAQRGGVLLPGAQGRWLDSVNAQFNKQYGGDPSIPDLNQMKKGGWLDAYSKQTKLRGNRGYTSKNIKTSINKLMLRNETLFGPKGKKIYDPMSKYQPGGPVWQDEGSKNLKPKAKFVPRMEPITMDTSGFQKDETAQILPSKYKAAEQNKAAVKTAIEGRAETAYNKHLQREELKKKYPTKNQEEIQRIQDKIESPLFYEPAGQLASYATRFHGLTDDELGDITGSGTMGNRLSVAANMAAWGLANEVGGKLIGKGIEYAAPYIKQGLGYVGGKLNKFMPKTFPGSSNAWKPPTEPLIIKNEADEIIYQYDPADYQNFNTPEMYNQAKNDLQFVVQRDSKKELERMAMLEKYGIKTEGDFQQYQRKLDTDLIKYNNDMGTNLNVKNPNPTQADRFTGSTDIPQFNQELEALKLRAQHNMPLENYTWQNIKGPGYGGQKTLADTREILVQDRPMYMYNNLISLDESLRGHKSLTGKKAFQSLSPNKFGGKTGGWLDKYQVAGQVPRIDPSLMGTPNFASETIRIPESLKEDPFVKANNEAAAVERNRLAYIEQEKQRKANEEKTREETRTRVRAKNKSDVERLKKGLYYDTDGRPINPLYSEDVAVDKDIKKREYNDKIEHWTNVAGGLGAAALAGITAPLWAPAVAGAAGTIGSALELPAVIGNTTLPWLTGNNALAAYFASKIPKNIEEGEYLEAGLNALPFLPGKTALREAVNESKGVLNKFMPNKVPGSPNASSLLERINLERGVKNKSNIIKENIQDGNFKINSRSTPSKGLVNVNIKSPTGSIQATRNPDGSYGLSFKDNNPFNAGKSMLKLKDQLAGKTIHETKSFSTDSYANILNLKKKLPFEDAGFVPLNSSNKANNFLDDLFIKNTNEWSASAKFKSEEAAIEGAKRMDDYMLKLGETTKSKVVNNNGKFEVHVPNYKIKVPEVNTTKMLGIGVPALNQKKLGGWLNKYS